jgi:hypothetical protein
MTPIAPLVTFLTLEVKKPEGKETIPALTFVLAYSFYSPDIIKNL